MACGCCGKCGCQCGSLPYTMTVQFSGLPTKTQGNNCDLTITSNFGYGAAGVATAPGGCDGDKAAVCQQKGSACSGGTATYDPSDRGPLTAVLLTDGGSCYAKLGRVAPVLTASASDGKGATLTITTTEAKACDDFCLPYWYVSKIKASGGGGYKHNSPVAISYSVGDTKVAAASATLQTAARLEPELTLSAEGGTGATLTPTIIPTGWGIDVIDVDSGGTKNTYGQAIKIEPGNGDKTVSAASAIAITKLTEPTVTINAADGTGATLTPTLTEQTWIDGKKYWKVSSISVAAGGSGYKKGSGLTASTDDKSDAAFCGKVTAVGSGGSISAVSVCDGGRYYKDTGEVESVKVVETGCYYHYTKDNPPTEPTLSASATDGSLSVTLKPVAWGVSAVSVDNGGTKYKYGASVSVSLGSDDFLDSAFSGKAKTTLVAPTLTVAACKQSGSGADLTPTLQNYTDADGIPYWAVSSITVKSGGVNYEVGDDVVVTVSAGAKRSDSEFSSRVTTIDEDTGKITAVTVSNGGKFYRDTGVISSVSIADRGRYYKYHGTPTGITLQSGGRYYREDKDADPYVADVKVAPCGRSDAITATAAINKSSGTVVGVTLEENCSCFTDAPTISLSGGGGEGATAEASVDEDGAITAISIVNGGTGYTSAPTVTINGEKSACKTAQISATVDSKTTSDTFGQITKLTIDNGGDCYLAWQWIKTCYDKVNGKSLVLRADEPIPLVALCQKSCFGSGLSVSINPIGVRVQPTVKVSGSGTKGTITATLTKGGNEDDNEYLPYWTISSVSASGGSGYPEESSATVTPQACTTTTEAADITLTATPIVTDEVTGKQTGGALTGATVNNGGKYYLQLDYDGQPTPIRAFTVGSKGSGYAKYGREQPSLTLSATGGSGVTFTPSLATKKDKCGLDYWYIDSVSVSGSNGGYTSGQVVSISVASGVTTEQSASLSIVTKADEEGQPVGRIDSVSVSSGGRYYKENKSLTPYVADVTVEADQATGSSGSGAEFKVTVNQDPNSDKFGQVSKVEFTNHGSGYTLFGGSSACTYSGGCTSGCSVGSPPAKLTFRGDNKEPEVTLADATFRATDKVADCRTLPNSATVLHSSAGGSVTITRGGAWVTGGADCGCGSGSCNGECECAADCGPGCRCSNGRCDQACSGSCDTNGDCGEGCECIDNKCTLPPCCYPRTFAYCCEGDFPPPGRVLYETDEEKAVADATCEANGGYIGTYTLYSCGSMTEEECMDRGGTVLQSQCEPIPGSFPFYGNSKCVAGTGPSCEVTASSCMRAQDVTRYRDRAQTFCDNGLCEFFFGESGGRCVVTDNVLPCVDCGGGGWAYHDVTACCYPNE